MRTKRLKYLVVGLAIGWYIGAREQLELDMKLLRDSEVIK